jgi:succinate dehydrogenase / fumarate reductase iron-sulfur subunit
MLVNGRPRQACTTRLEAVSPKGKPVVLAPLSKFPVIRDLVVDRSRLFDDYSRVHAWIEVDSLRSRDPEPPRAPGEGTRDDAFSRCTSCGACLEACPQYGEHSEFVGAAALNQVHRLNQEPLGRHDRRERLHAVMAPGGVADCGKAQNCVEVCPVGVPLVDSIQHVSRDASKELLLGWLLG